MIDRIRPLHLDTQVRIRSSVQIGSLSGVILELVKNSLDAKASKISVQFDFAKGFCSITDNGQGIFKEDFVEGRVGLLYNTSKDIASNHLYGRFGRFLAALSGTSLLSITSSHKFEESTCNLILKNGKTITLNQEFDDVELGGSRHGTRVTVHDLFGAIPVRFKHNASRFENQAEVDREFRTLQQSLLSIILARDQPFSIEVCGMLRRYLHRATTWLHDPKAVDRFNLSSIVSAIFQAGLTKTPDITTWHRMTLHLPAFTLQAAVNLLPAASKAVQFVSINQYPLSPNISDALYERINALFNSSTFGMHEDIQGMEMVVNRHRSNRINPSGAGKTEFKRWPMLYIRIATQPGVYHDEATGVDADQLLSAIDKALQGLIAEFLETYGFKHCKSKSSNAAKQSKSISNTTDFPGFINWSRIKSGNRMPTDVLTGLPFMCKADPTTGSTLRTPSDDAAETVSLHWTNPRNGKILHINPRTGMALPQHNEEKPQTLRRKPRKLNETVGALKDCVLPTLLKEPLKSCAPECDIPSSKHSLNQALTCQSGKSIEISGPISTKPGCMSLSKEMLKTANVLGQVDEKFILASAAADDTHDTLILIDQHAADERVKLEEMLQKVCEDKPVSLSTPMTFQVDKQDMWRFQCLQAYFALWKIHYDILPNQIQVTILPDLIAERCRMEPRLLMNLLRREIWRGRGPVQKNMDQHWLNKIAACPQGVLDMLISRACRSAIMFNDRLTIAQGQKLVQQLGECTLPFQCAHGRPSFTIVAQFAGQHHKHEDESSSFGQGWKAWSDEVSDW